MDVDNAETGVQWTCPGCTSVLAQDASWEKVPATPTRTETWICSRCYRDAKRDATKEYKNNYAEVGWQSPDEYMRTWQQWDAELKRELHFAVRLCEYFQNA